MDDIAAELFGPSPPMPGDEFDNAVLDDALAAGFTCPMAIEVIERSASPMPPRSRRGCVATAAARCSTAATTSSSPGAGELIAQNLETHHRTADGDGYELVQQARMTGAQRA